MLGLGDFNLLLPCRSEFRNVLVMYVHVRAQKLQNDTSLVFGRDGSCIEPSVSAVKAPDPHRPRELLACSNALAPGAEVLFSIVGMYASPGIRGQVARALSAIREETAIDPHYLARLRKSYKDMGGQRVEDESLQFVRGRRHVGLSDRSGPRNRGWLRNSSTNRGARRERLES